MQLWNLSQSIRAATGLRLLRCECGKCYEVFRCARCRLDTPYCRGAADEYYDYCDYCVSEINPIDE
jgi:hypothetical protein